MGDCFYFMLTCRKLLPIISAYPLHREVTLDSRHDTIATGAGQSCKLFYDYLVRHPANGRLVHTYDIMVAFMEDDEQNLMTMYNFAMSFAVLRFLPNVRNFKSPDMLYAVPDIVYTQARMRDILSTTSLRTLELCGASPVADRYSLMRNLDVLSELPHLCTLQLHVFELAEATEATYQSTLMAKVTTLHLGHCAATASQLKYFLSLFTSLQHLRLTWLPNICAGEIISAVSEGLGKSTLTLHSLKISTRDCPSGLQSPAPPSDWLTGFPNLRTLDICGHLLEGSALLHLPTTVCRLVISGIAPDNIAYVIGRWAKDKRIKRVISLRPAGLDTALRKALLVSSIIENTTLCKTNKIDRRTVRIAI